MTLTTHCRNTLHSFCADGLSPTCHQAVESVTRPVQRRRVTTLASAVARPLYRTCDEPCHAVSTERITPMDWSLESEKRFWAKVDRRGSDDCWEWTASKCRLGYGQVKINYRHLLAHRVAYELVRGPIPEGLCLDHLCRNRGCVNPSHLDPVTHRENVLRGKGFATSQLRKTHCIRGHEFTPENTLVSMNRRTCRACNRIRSKARRQPK